MRNPKSLFFAILFLTSLLMSCSKSKSVIAPSVPEVIGTWKMERIIVTGLPTTYNSLNNKNLDPLQFFGISSVYKIFTEKLFTDKETSGSGFISDLNGSWAFATNLLTLTFTDNSTEALYYNSTSKVLSTNPFKSAISLQNPTTQVVESVPCSLQIIYVKQ